MQHYVSELWQNMLPQTLGSRMAATCSSEALVPVYQFCGITLQKKSTIVSRIHNNLTDVYYTHDKGVCFTKYKNACRQGKRLAWIAEHTEAPPIQHYNTHS